MSQVRQGLEKITRHPQAIYSPSEIISRDEATLHVRRLVCDLCIFQAFQPTKSDLWLALFDFGPSKPDEPGDELFADCVTNDGQQSYSSSQLWFILN